MTVAVEDLLSGLPITLRKELIDEYNGLVSNYFEGRWRPAELHAGRFCEVVYTVIAGRAAGNYPSNANKPPDFVKACKVLENSTSLERGLRVLATRILPGLYEIRNNRDVGHVGGDVDSNFMDSSYAISASSWLLAELIRVFHNLSVLEATRSVDNLTQLKTPAVWVDEDIRRVLNPTTKLSDQCLILIASAGSATNIYSLAKWTETKNKTYLKKVVSALHKRRLIEAADPEQTIKLLPGGAAAVRELLAA